ANINTLTVGFFITASAVPIQTYLPSVVPGDIRSCVFCIDAEM
ncbi:2097_t:CDS:1, partial [Dentiscutata erythropus]